MNSARATSSPTVSIAVGAVFRFYLPRAHTLAHGPAQVEKDPVLVAAIQDRLRQIPAANAQTSPGTNPPPTPARPTTGT